MKDIEGGQYLLELVAGDDGGLGHVLEQRAHHIHTPVSPLLQHQDYSLNREGEKPVRWNSTLRGVCINTYYVIQ